MSKKTKNSYKKYFDDELLQLKDDGNKNYIKCEFNTVDSAIDTYTVEATFVKPGGSAKVSSTSEWKAQGGSAKDVMSDSNLMCKVASHCSLDLIASICRFRDDDELRPYGLKTVTLHDGHTGYNDGVVIVMVNVENTV